MSDGQKAFAEVSSEWLRRALMEWMAVRNRLGLGERLARGHRARDSQHRPHQSEGQQLHGDCPLHRLRRQYKSGRMRDNSAGKLKVILPTRSFASLAPSLPPLSLPPSPLLPPPPPPPLFPPSPSPSLIPFASPPPPPFSSAVRWPGASAEGGDPASAFRGRRSSCGHWRNPRTGQRSPRRAGRPHVRPVFRPDPRSTGAAAMASTNALWMPCNDSGS